MTTLEVLLADDEEVLHEFLRRSKPFKYIDYLKVKYEVYENRSYLYDFSLDIYNYYKSIGVDQNRVFYSLKLFTTHVIKAYLRKREVKIK